MDDIEPRIWPLVDALNATGLVRTFSSCEGHYEPTEQKMVDRTHAYVRFIPAPNTGNEPVEALMTYLLTRFKTRHGLVPIHVTGYKLYTPIDEKTTEETFVLELRPFNRFDLPDRKRADTDRAVAQLVSVLSAASVEQLNSRPKG